MSKRVLLWFSVCLNVLLSGWAGGIWLQRHGTAPVAPPPAATVPVSEQLVDSAAPPLAPPVIYRTNRFHWSMLEADNYPQFVANLRAVGCPEETIRDMVVAEIEADYKLKAAAVHLPAPFWSTADTRAAYERAEREQQQVLHDERTALLLQLGIDNPVAPDDDSSDLISCAIMFFLLGPMPLETARSALTEIMRTESLTDLARNRAADKDLLSEEAAVSAAKQQALDRLKGVLSPAQFREFTLRLAGMTVREQMPGMLSAQELRGMAEIYQDVTRSTEFLPDLDSGNHLSEAEESELEARFRAFLGEQRFNQLKEESGEPNQ